MFSKWAKLAQALFRALRERLKYLDLSIPVYDVICNDYTSKVICWTSEFLSKNLLSEKQDKGVSEVNHGCYSQRTRWEG